jgi:hypothetical protein
MTALCIANSGVVPPGLALYPLRFPALLCRAFLSRRCAG